MESDREFGLVWPVECFSVHWEAEGVLRSGLIGCGSGWIYKVQIPQLRLGVGGVRQVLLDENVVGAVGISNMVPKATVRKMYAEFWGNPYFSRSANL